MTHELNLLPADFAEKAKWRKTAVVWAGTVVCGFVMILSVFNLSKEKITTLQRDIAQLQQKQNAFQPIQENLQRLEQKREQAKKIEAGYLAVTQSQGLSHISDILSRVIPPRVQVTSLKVGGAGQLSLKGKADSNVDVAIFMRNLNPYPEFSNTTLRYAAREQDLEQSYILFEIKKDAEKITQK